MFRPNKERLKSVLLIILIFGSFAQVGILWSLKNHGLPIRFLTAFLPKFASTVSTTSSELKQSSFKPYRIIVSEGFDESHWVLQPDSSSGDNGGNYNKLWNELKLYLGMLADGSGTAKGVFSEDSQTQWERVIHSRAVIFEYRTMLKSNLLSYFIRNAPFLADGPTGIYKVAILPWEDINEGTFNLYFLDDDSKNGAKVYKYSLQPAGKRMNKSEYEALFEELRKMTVDKALRSYSTFGELFPAGTKYFFPVRRDILLVKYGPKGENLQTIAARIPEGLDTTTASPAQIGELLLGDERHGYDMSEDIYGNMVFKNVNSMYKLYEDGVMEYRYFSEYTEAEKGNEVAAFENAVEFIRKARLLPQGAEIFLSDFRGEGANSYQITFDYRIGGIPVSFDYDLQGRDNSNPGAGLKGAITIEANSRRVLKCWWILRSFEISREGKKPYNVLFSDFMDLAFSKENYADLKNDKTFGIKDIGICYRISRETLEEATEDGEVHGKGVRIPPSWIIFSEGENSSSTRQYTVPMNPIAKSVD